MKRFVQGTVLLAATIAAGPLMAEDAQPDRMAGGNDVVVLSDWVYDPLYESAWSMDDMIGQTDVIGLAGDEIGEVENLVIGDDGRIVALIAEVGGFWDMGDTHVSIPWGEVQLSTDLDNVKVPIDADSVDQYMTFGERSVLLKEQADRIVTVQENSDTGTEVFKATDLIGDYAYLDDGVQYGYVDDLLVRKGRLSAIVIDAHGYDRPGHFAFPYGLDGAWLPHGLRYEVPYTSGQIAAIQTFDYDQMKRRPEGAAARGTDQSASN